VVEAWLKLWPANGMRCRTCHKRLRWPLTEIGQDLPRLAMSKRRFCGAIILVSGVHRD
jgi:hypothetical protein